LGILLRDELVANAGDLKVLPFVARKVLELVESENSSASQLSKVIEKDQTIAVKVLKVSNSALYGLRKEVTSLQQAITLLGLNAINSLVIALSTKSLYKRFGITEQMMWDHSVGTSITAKLISSGFGAETEGIAFIGGLMHDFGKVVMNNESPEAFAEVMMRTYNEGIDSITAEEEVFGYNHTEVGSMVAEKWGFPSIHVSILRRHHLNYDKLEDIEEQSVARVIACVHLANNICKVLGIGYRSPNETILVNELPSTVFLGLTKEKMDVLVKDVVEAYEKEKTLFQ
jgi:putative nucleotidyltransferase with HDIG domain